MAGKKTSTTKADAKKTDKPEADAVEEMSAAVEDADKTEFDLEQDGAEVPDPYETTDAEKPADDIKDEDILTDDKAEAEDTTDDPKAEPVLEEIAADEAMESFERDDVDAKDFAEPDPEPTPDPAPVVKETVVERQGGFAPMVIGGLVAGAIGFGAAYVGLPQMNATDNSEFEQNMTAQLEAQSAQISTLSSQIDTLPPPADMSGIEAAQGDLGSAIEGLSTRIENVEGQLGGLETRLSDVEKQPMTEGASDAAVAAYERELKALQDAMATQRAEIETMMADAANMEDNAAETAEATIKRAALTRIQTALDAGTGFAPALADLQETGIAIPEPLLSVAETGVPSLADLQAAFPAAAREALAASRRVAAEEGESGGLGAFFKTQLGARSLEPREGNDPDAVLSRAEAAAREGRLQDALAEIEALPEEGRAQLTDWASKATQRLEAVAAAETLGQELN